jgi:hypothetical protein
MATDENDLRPSGGILYNVGLLVLCFFLSVLGSLLMAGCAGLVYGWFIERDLGPGPSHAGWFGVATLVHMLMASPLINVKKESHESGFGTSIGLVVGLALISVVITLGAYLTGLVVGWI